LGRAVLSVLRAEARYKWHGPASEDVKVMKWTTCVSAEVHFIEKILRTSMDYPVSQLLPDECFLQSPDYTLWWGLLAATLPVSMFHRYLCDTWKSFYARSSAMSAGDVCELATWRRKFATEQRGLRGGMPRQQYPELTPPEPPLPPSTQAPADRTQRSFRGSTDSTRIPAFTRGRGSFGGRKRSRSRRNDGRGGGRGRGAPNNAARGVSSHSATVATADSQ
jgi:hypothetical protein